MNLYRAEGGEETIARELFNEMAGPWAMTTVKQLELYGFSIISFSMSGRSFTANMTVKGTPLTVIIKKNTIKPHMDAYIIQEIRLGVTGGHFHFIASKIEFDEAVNLKPANTIIRLVLTEQLLDDNERIFIALKKPEIITPKMVEDVLGLSKHWAINDTIRSDFALNQFLRGLEASPIMFLASVCNLTQRTTVESAWRAQSSILGALFIVCDNYVNLLEENATETAQQKDAGENAEISFPRPPVPSGESEMRGLPIPPVIPDSPQEEEGKEPTQRKYMARGITRRASMDS